MKLPLRRQRKPWLALWLFALLLGLSIPGTAYSQPASPFTVRVTPAGPLTLPVGGSQTLTATATYPAFTTGTGFNETVHAVALQPDGKVVVGGAFTSYNGSARNRLVRLNADGSLDPSFDIGTGLDGPVNAVVVQPDGAVVVAGAFSSYNGAARSNLVRLTPTGSIDASFRQNGSGLNGAVQTLALQPDGQLVVGGAFTSYNGTARTYLARLTTVGNLDISLVPNLTAPVTLLARQSDGKFLVNAAALVRLTYNGQLDPTFTNSLVSSSRFETIRITTLSLQPDDKAIVGGYTQFSTGSANSLVARLNLTGGQEFRYNDPNLTAQGVTALAVQPDGRILVGQSSFAASPAGGTAYVNQYLVRLTAAGSREAILGSAPNFNAPRPVAAIVVQPNGQIVIGGSFTDYNGTPQNRLARLHPDGSLNTAEVPVVDATYVWNMGATGPSLTVTTSGTYSVTAALSGYSTTSNAVVITNPSVTANFQLNAGGMALVTNRGVFAADQYYSAASATATTTATIAGTNDDGLYQSERYSTNGQLRYAVPVANGTYSVVLHFAETYWTQPGQRVFNIALEGSTLRTNYDIVAKVGPLTATIETFTVTVADGVLNLDLTVPYLSGGADQAKLSALEILPESSGRRILATRTRTVDRAAVLTVYPNPTADGRFTLFCSSAQTQAGTLTLVDQLGRTVHEQAVQLRPGSHQLTPPPTTTQAGFYQLVLRTADGQRVTQKVVVQP